MTNDEIKEIIKRCEKFQKPKYRNQDLAAKLTTDFENIKNAGILSEYFNDKIKNVIFFGLENKTTYNDTNIILVALKNYIRK